MSTASTSPAGDHLTLRARMAPELPDGLIAHIDRVVALTQTLARRHGANEQRAMLAAQGHDLVRHWGNERWLAEEIGRAHV